MLSLSNAILLELVFDFHDLYLLHVQITAIAEVLLVAGHMDLSRQNFPSPTVTTANQFNAVTTCQSSTCISSCFGQPVNTSVQANSSIRSIRPNFVKSRAQVFERKDTDVTKKLLPAKAVTEGNSYAKTSASPLSVNTDVEGRHSAEQLSESVGHVEHTGVSSGLSVRLTDTATVGVERSPECQSPPLHVHHDLSPVSTVDDVRHVPSNVQSDIVTQRLQMFENKPVVPNKPAIPLKPQSPRPGSSADSVGIYRSRSSDSVKQPDVNCQVKASFHSPPVRLQVHDNQPSLTSSHSHANDVGVKRRSAGRQVKETVVVSPPSSQHMNESVSAAVNSPSSPYVTETSIIISPKPPPRHKAQVKRTVAVNPSPPSRSTDTPPSSSCPETSKIVSPKPPQKPPRMAAVSHDPVSPARDDSYGLLVYAAGAETPLVRVAKLSPDIGVPGDRPLQKISSKHVADMCSRLESHSEGNTTCSVPAPVLNTSRLQNRTVSSVNDAWEKKFIRAPKSSPVVRSRGEKENFVTKRRMNNPSYMYITVSRDDIIPSQQKIIPDMQALTRHLSDDMLNIPPAPMLPSPKSPTYKQPLYAVPFDFISNSAAYDADEVVFDSAGYAMPYLHTTPQFKVVCSYCSIHLH